MGKSGVSLNITNEQVIDALYQCEGVVLHARKTLNIASRTMYDLLDIYPEIAEARDKARLIKAQDRVEAAIEKCDEHTEQEEDKGISLRAAQYTLEKSKYSPYYVEEAKKDQPAENAGMVDNLDKMLQHVPPSIVGGMTEMNDEEKAEVEAFMVEMKRKKLAEAKD